MSHEQHIAVDHAIDHHAIDHHVKIYIRVFIALLILTGITVAVSQLHLGVSAAIALGLFIATVKASLVACYFMHLIDERKLVLWVLGLAGIFFLFELLLPFITDSGNISNNISI